ncbi:hypothetical protein AgCh_037836 [Apium graveolens]
MTHHNWPNTFPNYHHMMPPSSAAQPPYWVDEFLDFSSSRRNSHRRSVSDPIAFAEVQFGEDCNNNNNNNNGFDRLDDEQLCNMFADEVPPTVTSTSNPSTSSERNSENEQEKTMLIPQMPKKEPGEVDSECELEIKPGHTFSAGKDDGDTIIVDPKRVKRILANRQSAQRSRVRKLQYISELERSVTSLQTEVSALSPRVAFLDHQRLILNVDNSALKQRIAVLAQDKLFKDAHQEALKKEIERLRRVYQDQSLKKMDHNATVEPPPEAAAAVTDEHEQQQ